MSVPFATWQDKDIHYKPLRASGFNGFPFPVVEVTRDQVGPGTFYPVGFTLPDAVYAYWKVKNWNIHVDVTLTPDEGDGDPTNTFGDFGSDEPRTNFQQPGFIGTFDPITDPKQLCYQAGWIESDDDTTSNFWFFVPSDWDLEGQPAFDLGGWNGQAVRITGDPDKLVYPATLIDCQVDVGTEWYQNPAGTLYIMDYSFPLFADDDHFTGDITVTVNEEWDF